MKRVILAFLVLVGALSIALYTKLRAQDLAAHGASRGSGTIEGTQVDIVSRLPTRVASIPVREGDVVKAGQVVVELDCDDAKAALAQADAALAAAKAMVEAANVQVALGEHAQALARKQTRAAQAQAQAARAQRQALTVQKDSAARIAGRIDKMRPTGGASEQDLDRATSAAASLEEQVRATDAQANAAAAQAAVVAGSVDTAGLQARLASAQKAAAEQQAAAAQAARDRAAVLVRECTLTSPVDGVVEDRYFEPGENVLPGARLLRIVDVREVKATFYLPNAELAAAKPGRAVQVVPDAMPDRKFDGQIRRVSEEAEFTPRNVQTRDDRDRLVYAVEVSLANPDGALRPGMPVEITIPGTGR
jgi:HlyD family secretion protein